MSTSEYWDVRRHTAWCTSPVSIVSQCNLVSGWWLKKQRSALPRGPYGLGRTLRFLCCACCVWHRHVTIGSAKALQTWSLTLSLSCFRKRFSSWTWTNWLQQVMVIWWLNALVAAILYITYGWVQEGFSCSHLYFRLYHLFLLHFLALFSRHFAMVTALKYCTFIIIIHAVTVAYKSQTFVSVLFTGWQVTGFRLKHWWCVFGCCFTVDCAWRVHCCVKGLLASSASLRTWTRMRTSWRRPVMSW